ncbi:hypothetical protein CMI37_12040, partial [Candidatus Pacearchaeota archaeon]|nr:hypothetical protein [Candidatus Pacearchaeota archaeon]
DAVRSLFGRDSYNKCWGTGEVEWKDGHTTTEEETAQINTEYDRLQAEYDTQDYARKRKAEYPTIQELVVALYDEDDKAAIDAKRAEVKAKYSKP